MSTFKKAKVVMITTNKFTLTTLCKCIRVNGLLMDALKLNHLSKPLTEEELEDANHGKDVIGIDRYFEAQHLYIISDDEIKDGDYFLADNRLNTTSNKGLPNWVLCKCTKVKNSWVYCNEIPDEGHNGDWCKKIIATTDESLNLPQPSQQFIQKYIEEYNKGNIITDVLVEYDTRSKTNA